MAQFKSLSLVFFSLKKGKERNKRKGPHLKLANACSLSRRYFHEQWRIMLRRGEARK